MSLPQLLIHLDVLVASLIAVFVALRRVRGDRAILRRFVSGFCIGLTWELPFYLRGPAFRTDADYAIQVTFPLHPHLQPIVQSVWDGGLFLLGVVVVQCLCRRPCFVRFRAAELAVLVLFGNLQELLVELLASGAGMWTFTPKPWNPLLFAAGPVSITLLPQVIWTVAPVVFYLAVLRFEAPHKTKSAVYRAII